MLYKEFQEYLEEVSEKSDFKVNMRFEGGYIVFSNSGQRGERKYFTLSLLSIRNTLENILNNHSKFEINSSYIEQKWRDLSQYYTDETIKSIATVQTKPFFTTLNKIINWANNIKDTDDKTILLDKDSLKTTISQLNKIVNSFILNQNNTNKIEKFINESLGKLDFTHKNLLLKGVPGTGKSHTIENIIEKNLELKDKNNICHINIHSASSNADLMQGIGISSKGGKIEYKEKQGLIYNHIKKALFAPNQPFVLILEEIQENSLNELIGDLIYLIEDTKRVTVDSANFEDGKEYEYQEFIEEVLKDEKNKHYIEIPYLVDTSTSYRKMVLPSNLYIFCTSNYRDDKKVIEDNLLRRFDVVEIYPQNQASLGVDVFKSKDVSDFLDKLNASILEKFKNEIHPDRYLVGHANWLDISDKNNDRDKKLYYTALLKVIIEFKEIREVDFDTYLKEILKDILTENGERINGYIETCKFEYKSYKEMVEKLQKKIYFSFLK